MLVCPVCEARLAMAALMAALPAASATIDGSNGVVFRVRAPGASMALLTEKDDVCIGEKEAEVARYRPQGQLHECGTRQQGTNQREHSS